jgi:hypothetical protein
MGHYAIAFLSVRLITIFTFGGRKQEALDRQCLI